MGELFYYRTGLHNFAGLFTHKYCVLYLKNYFKRNVRKKLQTLDNLVAYEKENNLLDFVIKIETLEDDLIRILEEVGYELESEQIQSIYEGRKKPINKSAHRTSGYYYDRETLDLVGNLERFIIDKYDYAPPEIT
jgi:hypothetical protein